MERESFEDEEVAKLLNDHYISIKVDREERPDIDHIYMSFCQATSGHGGWPLSIFMTSDKKPFYAGTYFPKTSKHGYVGFIEILNAIQKKWHENHKGIEASAEKIVDMLKEMEVEYNDQSIDNKILDRCYLQFERNFDYAYGGFSKAPKFPTPHNLLYLLRYYKIYNTKKALEMVEKTLEQMYKGGIFDHLGGGFSRYSVDGKWLVPHFEKMLYDNAMLLIAYAEAFQLTKKPLYKDITEKIIKYIIRDMTDEEGGFYSAEDADSEGHEGKFYVWSVDEIKDILGEADAKLFSQHYNMKKNGNFEGKNILNLIDTSLEILEKNPELKTKLDELSQKLFEARKLRIPPYKDDKILTSWNGLMIAALSIAGKAYKNDEYIQYAKKAISFIQNKLTNENGRLLARYCEGDTKHLGVLEDYAFLIWACIELYEAVFETEYLFYAVKLTDQMIELFSDEEGKGFYLYGKDAEQLIVRPKSIYDGAIPSGNSVAAYNLIRLAKLTGNSVYEERAVRLLEHFGGLINDTPIMYTFMLCAKMLADQPSQEIVLAGDIQDKVMRKMIWHVSDKFLPFTMVLLNDPKGDLSKVNTFASEQKAIDEKPTAYICEHYACKRPVQDIETLIGLI